MSNWLYNTTGPREHAPKAMAGKVIPALAAVSFVARLQCATQFFAHEFQYQSALGARLRQLSARWSILRCASRRYAAYTNAMMRSGYVRTVTALGLVALIISRMVLDGSGRQNPHLQGWARWANLKEIQLSGHLPRLRILWEVTTGKALTTAAHVYVGVWLDKRATQYLLHNGPESDFGYTWTTSGKSRTGRNLVRRSWVGRGTQQNRRNNQSLGVQEYFTVARFRTWLKNQRKPKKTSMTFEKGKRLPGQGGWENGIKGGGPTNFP